MPAPPLKHLVEEAAAAPPERRPNDARDGFSWLQASRFAAALMVVLDHAAVTIGAPSYYPGYRMLGSAFGAGRYGVDYFFVLSGFIITHVHWHDVSPGAVGRGYRVRRFLRRRMVRIYPTYLTVLLLVLVPLYVFPTRFDADIRSPWYLFEVATLIRGNGNVLTSAWTLTHELVFYGLFALAIGRPAWGAATLAGWFVMSALCFAVTTPCPNLLSPEHIGFLFGMAGCYFVRTARVPAPSGLLLAGLLGFAACYVLAGCGAAGDINAILSDPRARGPLPPLALSSVLIVIGLAELERAAGWRAPRPLRLLGDASYSLYLLHFPVLVVIVKLFARHHGERFVPLPLLVAGGTVAAVAASVAFHVAVEKPLLLRLNRTAGRDMFGKNRPARPALAARDA